VSALVCRRTGTGEEGAMRLPLVRTPDEEAALSWYTLAAVIIRPPMEVLTARDWSGGEHLGAPGQGRIVAVNHISWFDPFAVAHFVNDHGRSPRLLAKAGVFDVPVGGAILRGVRQIPVERGADDASRALDAAIAAVRNGECVVVYPEGTITRDPDLWPMTGKTGAARIALATGAPVVPVAQWGAHEVMRPYRLEARLLPRRTMRFRAGPPVDLTDLAGARRSAAAAIAATNRIMGAITAQLAELRDEPPPDGRWDRRAGARVAAGPTDLQAARALWRRQQRERSKAAGSADGAARP
jgi:1-acyl-sn-glycerol-3-phosphate acyltransferase